MATVVGKMGKEMDVENSRPAKPLLFSWFFFCFLAIGTPIRAEAANPTTAGTATAVQSTLNAIGVTMPYTGDDNGTSSYTVQYKLSASGSWTTWIAGASNTPSPYVKNITGLVNGSTYDVRVTYLDASDGLSNPGSATQTISNITLASWVDNPGLHNSNRFPGTTKHSGSWGVPGGQYGGFTCQTCHGKNTGNIKQIVKSGLSAPTGTFPAQAAGGSIVLTTTDQQGNPSGIGFGDDSAARDVNFVKVCEACHSVTNYHRYDTSGQSNLTHYNGQDCTKCHQHKDGFKAGCNACHGNPPTQDSDLVYQLDAPDDTGSRTWGEHQKHAVVLGYACNTCHNGWENNGEMPKAGNINIGFNAFGKTTGSYDGRTLGAPQNGKYTAAAGLTLTQTKTSGATTCAFYCHGYQVPQWNPAATAACGACHGKVAGYGDNRDGIPDGSAGVGGRALSGALTGFKVGKHANHLDDSVAATGDPCALCHNGAGYADATHVDGTTNLSMHASAGGSASYATGSPGTCSNLSCHGNAPWDSAATGGCDFCHGGGGQYWPNGSAYPDRSGRHDKHLTALAAKLSITIPGTDAQQKRMCAYCHNDATGVGGSGHNANGGDSTADLGGFNPIWDATDPPSVADAGAAFVSANGGCNSIDCHNNKATGSTTYGWRNSGLSACIMCHVDVTTDSTHVAHTGSAANYGRTIVCTDCHNATTWASSAPGTGHLNGSWTIVNSTYTGTSTTQAKGTCGTNACHQNGLSAAPLRAYTWGTALANDCASCHAAAMASNKHNQHLVSNSLPGTDLDFGTADECRACHNTTTSGTGRASGSAHLNGTRNLAFNATYNYENLAAARAAGAGATTTCSNVRCHSGVTTPQWNSTVTCGSCHNTGGTGPLPGQAGVTRSHPYHANNDSNYTDCDKCHGASGVTVSATYTATGGGGAGKLHQNLVVNLWINGAANRYAGDASPAGVNWAAGAGQADDGTCSSTACHGGKTPQWGVYNDTVSGCRVCHDPTFGSYDGTSNPLPPAVARITAARPHTDPDGTGGTYSAGDCRGCHAGHNQGVAISLPPTSWPLAAGETHVNGNMRTLLGFTGYTGSSISIGGPAAALVDGAARPLVHAAIRGKTTEAEVCWSCHDSLSTPVSEWGYNSDPDGTTWPKTVIASVADGSVSSHNFGWLYSAKTGGVKVSDWTTSGAWIRDGYRSVLDRPVASIHAVSFTDSDHSSSVANNLVAGKVKRGASSGLPNPDTGTPVLESKAAIRCTYCHDVHDTFGPNSKPYVRGSWLSNPYPPDMPPLVGDTYPAANKYTHGTNSTVPVPRLYVSTSKNKGGYFIDQNSGRPTDSQTLPNSAGLCTICHGSSVDSMDYYTGAKLWRPSQVNGHANSTIGGGGASNANARNIFDGRRGATTGFFMALQDSVNVSQWGKNKGPTGQQVKGTAPFGSTFSYQPADGGVPPAKNTGWYGGTEGNSTRGAQYSTWYSGNTTATHTASIGTDGVTTRAHTFTCSKCHSPHAAKLPALLITNCLDQPLGTWTANANSGRGTIGPNGTSTWLPYVKNNCHSKTARDTGWNYLETSQ
ncbi:c-type cytochrome [Desulfuromonas versatilis]|uniref:C-type cytochrome n=1 Tax=Desulfuromonas versatilis TaxID=2802975 RepID=A0ABN6DZP6_9BACT|nr:CxxxxCH/CxxCH domain-containing protein [Desulfuromonas versatilis]BCR05573.1 c-type cytochrome [Desulfuromonas versatilis]